MKPAQYFDRSDAIRARYPNSKAIFELTKLGPSGTNHDGTFDGSIVLDLLCTVAAAVSPWIRLADSVGRPTGRVSAAGAFEVPAGATRVASGSMIRMGPDRSLGQTLLGSSVAGGHPGDCRRQWFGRGVRGPGAGPRLQASPGSNAARARAYKCIGQSVLWVHSGGEARQHVQRSSQPASRP